eukprot:UN19728
MLYIIVIFSSLFSNKSYITVYFAFLEYLQINEVHYGGQGHHRTHHFHCDSPLDTHSPVQQGFITLTLVGHLP